MTKSKKKVQPQQEELKFVPGRKVAWALMVLAAMLALVIALFSLVQGTLAWVAIFGAIAAIAFYMAHALRAELREAQ